MWWQNDRRADRSLSPGWTRPVWRRASLAAAAVFAAWLLLPRRPELALELRTLLALGAIAGTVHATYGRTWPAAAAAWVADLAQWCAEAVGQWCRRTEPPLPPLAERLARARADGADHASAVQTERPVTPGDTWFGVVPAASSAATDVTDPAIQPATSPAAPIPQTRPDPGPAAARRDGTTGSGGDGTASAGPPMPAVPRLARSDPRKPVTQALVSLLTGRRRWQGSPSELLVALEAAAVQLGLDRADPEWPKAASRLGPALHAAATELTDAGLRVRRGRTGRARWIVVERVAVPELWR